MGVDHHTVHPACSSNQGGAGRHRFLPQGLRICRPGHSSHAFPLGGFPWRGSIEFWSAGKGITGGCKMSPAHERFKPFPFLGHAVRPSRVKCRKCRAPICMGQSPVTPVLGAGSIGSPHQDAASQQKLAQGPQAPSVYWKVGHLGFRSPPEFVPVYGQAAFPRAQVEAQGEVNVAD